MKAAPGLLLLVACGSASSTEVTLPAEVRHSAGLLQINGVFHALSFENSQLTSDPVQRAAQDIESVNLYLFQESLSELGLTPGPVTQSPSGARLPTPDRALVRATEGPQSDREWSEAPRWQGELVDLRVPREFECLNWRSNSRALPDLLSEKVSVRFALGIGQPGRWEEEMVLFGLDSGALYLLEEAALRPLPRIESGQFACGGACVVNAAFRGVGNELWFSYPKPEIGFRGAIHRAVLDLENARIVSSELWRKSANDHFSLDIDGQPRAPVRKIDTLTWRRKPNSRDVNGIVERHRIDSEETDRPEEPLSFSSPNRDVDERFTRGQLITVSETEIAALWPYEASSNVAFSAYSDLERITTSSITTIAYVPQLGLVLSDRQGQLFVHPSSPAEELRPLPSPSNRAVLAIEPVDGGFVVVDQDRQLHQFLVEDGQPVACPPVALSTTSTIGGPLWLERVQQDLVLLTPSKDLLHVEWLSAP